MSVTMIIPPAKAEVLALCSVADMKANLRISYTKEDAVIEACILAAYDWLAGEEGWLKRSVLATTWQLLIPSFSDMIELPKPAAVGAVTVSYMVDGNYQTLDVSNFRLLKPNNAGQVFLRRSSVGAWPTGIDRGEDAIEISYTAQMGDGTGAGIRARNPGLHKAMALLAGDGFRNREDTFTDIRMVEIDRRIVNGVQRYAGRYRFLNNHG